MINLLPPSERKQLAAARTNTLLLRYSVLLGVAIGIVILELLAVFIVVNIGKSQNEAMIQYNHEKTAGYASIQQEADTFRTNLATAKYILGTQASYSNLILTLAHALPSGAVVDTLSLDPSTFGTPTTLTILTTSYNRAIDVKAALQGAKVNNTTPLFSSVSFTSVSQSGDQKGPYPFTAVFNVTYSKALLAS